MKVRLVCGMDASGTSKKGETKRCHAGRPRSGLLASNSVRNLPRVAGVTSSRREGMLSHVDSSVLPVGVHVSMVVMMDSLLAACSGFVMSGCVVTVGVHSRGRCRWDIARGSIWGKTVKAGVG